MPRRSPLNTLLKTPSRPVAIAGVEGASSGLASSKSTLRNGLSDTKAKRHTSVAAKVKSAEKPATTSRVAARAAAPVAPSPTPKPAPRPRGARAAAPKAEAVKSKATSPKVTSPKATASKSATSKAEPSKIAPSKTSTPPKEAAASAAKVAAQKIPVAKPEAAKPEVEKPKRVRRARVPENLAQMYGQSEARRALDVPAEEARPARRDARSRALRKQVIQAGERVVARLAQVQERTVAPLVVGEEEDAPRKRSWQTRCGKCGASSSFKTAAALCPGCSAICVKP